MICSANLLVFYLIIHSISIASFLSADGTNTVKLITGAGVNDNKTYVQNDAAVYYKQTGLHNIAQEVFIHFGMFCKLGSSVQSVYNSN